MMYVKQIWLILSYTCDTCKSKFVCTLPSIEMKLVDKNPDVKLPKLMCKNCDSESITYNDIEEEIK